MTTTLSPAYEALVELVRADGYCPTCLHNGIPTRMVQVSARAWICPVQRDEEKRISAAMRARVLVTASNRVDSIPF